MITISLETLRTVQYRNAFEALDQLTSINCLDNFSKSAGPIHLVVHSYPNYMGVPPREGGLYLVAVPFSYRAKDAKLERPKIKSHENKYLKDTASKD